MVRRLARTKLIAKSLAPSLFRIRSANPMFDAAMQPLTENNVNVPAFLSKLWKMVNDPSTDQLISWSQSGSSFIIQNQAQFWYELLPVHYKHNNMSSFVRQLNMYGFHKISAIDSGTTEYDKDEIQFFHPYFQRNKPELLKSIKRKVTGTAKTQALATENGQNLVNGEDFIRVLTDVRSLKGKQKNVDNQLMAMKQENAILWRELALLRQKHIKQQQIVNKLIQFLVTIVQPSGRIGGIGVKRHYPLMLNECPKKKQKTPSESSRSTTDGPIIHELEGADLLQEELLAEAEDVSEDEINKDMLNDILYDNEFQDKPCLADESDLCDLQLQDKAFLNETAQDTILSNLMNGNYNPDKIRDDKVTTLKKEITDADELALATRDGRPTFSRLNSIEDLDSHIETTQTELQQFKDVLNGFSTLDNNALLGLFNDDPTFGLACNENEEAPKNDQLVSGSELAPYGPSIDFSNLFDDSSEEPAGLVDAIGPSVDADGSITTPQLLDEAPVFPNESRN